MNRVGRIAAATATLVLMGTAATAVHAQAQPANLSGLRAKPAAEDSTRWGVADPAKTFQLNSRKWGLKLDLNRPAGREPRERDLEAGAYYRITPSLRVGGAVKLEDKAEDARSFGPREQQPRVKLETAFQF